MHEGIRAIGAVLIVPLQAIEIQAKLGVRDLPKAQEKNISNLTQGKWLYKGYHSPRLFSQTPGNELASFLCERERKESNGYSNQPI
ncbi:MAG: hypothetical protein NXY57DRAFT_968504 [Lentinula lateritia]|nr:MAG: hypothetical protein NXY57DRAFT_968504 [Lentinula lateritia]